MRSADGGGQQPVEDSMHGMVGRAVGQAHGLRLWEDLLFGGLGHAAEEVRGGARRPHRGLDLMARCKMRRYLASTTATFNAWRSVRGRPLALPPVPSSSCWKVSTPQGVVHRASFVSQPDLVMTRSASVFVFPVISPQFFSHIFFFACSSLSFMSFPGPDVQLRSIGACLDWPYGWIRVVYCIL